MNLKTIVFKFKKLKQFILPNYMFIFTVNFKIYLNNYLCN